MPAPFVIPFNNNPSSVSVKTVSYTIPSGKYAQAYVEADSGGIFTINSVNAVTTSPFLNVDIAPAAFNSASYTAPTGYQATITGVHNGSATTFSVNGNANESLPTTTYSTAHNIGPGGTFVTAASGANSFVQGVATPSNATNRQATFWVPTGTVISGSGNWKAVVQEYNVIS